MSGARHSGAESAPLPQPLPADLARRARTWEEGIVPAWEARLAPPLIEAMTLPERGSVLVAECRTGYVAARLAERLPAEVRCIAIDPSREMLDVARLKFHADDRRVWWEAKSVDQLSYRSGVFGAALCFAGLITQEDAERAARELMRLTAPGGSVGLGLPLRTTLQAFYDLYREALLIADLTPLEAELDAFLARLSTPERLRRALLAQGAAQVDIHTVRTTQTFSSGQAFLLSPLVEGIFLPLWLQICREDAAREQIFYHIVRGMDAYFQGLPMELEVEAVWVHLRSPSA